MVAASPIEGRSLKSNASGAAGSRWRTRRPPRNRPRRVETSAAAFNGSLDNIAELLALLEKSRHTPPSPTPAGILIAGFQAFGRSLPNLSERRLRWRPHRWAQDVGLSRSSRFPHAVLSRRWPVGLRGNRGEASPRRGGDQTFTRCRRPGEDLLQRAARRVPLRPRRSQATSQGSAHGDADPLDCRSSAIGSRNRCSKPGATRPKRSPSDSTRCSRPRSSAP